MVESIGGGEEQSQEQEVTREWQETIRTGIAESLDNYELFGQVNLSPVTLTSGDDERTFAELSDAERKAAEAELFKAIGFNPKKPVEIGMYAFEAPEDAEWKGTAIARVYKTRRAKEDMFLHRIAYEHGEVEYMVAPKDFRL